MELKTETLGHSGMARIALAALAFSALSALCGCTGQGGADSQREAPGSVVAAVDSTAPVARYRHAGVELGGGKALVCGGLDGTAVYPRTCEVLEVVEETLVASLYAFPAEPAAVLAEPAEEGRVNAALTLLPSGGVLLVGGRGQTIVDGLEVGARASLPVSTWGDDKLKPSMNWQAAEAMVTTRELHTATLLGSSVVVIGGYNRAIGPSGQTVGTIEVRMDGALGSWQADPRYTEPRLGHSATLLKPLGSEARVLVLGGFDADRGGYLATGFIYSLEHGLRYITDMPSARMYHSATLLDDGSVLLVGGQAADESALADAWRYDPDADPPKPWQPVGVGGTGGTQLLARRRHKVARLGNYAIVVGGDGPVAGTAITSIQSYDSKLDTWSDLRPLASPREYFQLLKLSETQLVASGGSTKDGNGVNTSSELITLAALGEVASDPATCVSGHLADGVCCESDCSQPCHACDSAGLCQPLSGTPRNGHLCPGGLSCVAGQCALQCGTAPCRDGYFCAENGQCLEQKQIGMSCNGASECAKNAPCVDKVCCESACPGSCEACNQGSPGKCQVLAKGAAPVHGACARADDSRCGASCDGAARDRCEFAAPETSCAAATCEDASFQPARTCDGNGTCQTVAKQSCAPYACGRGECLHQCSHDADCTDGAQCEAGACVHCVSKQCNALGYQCDRENDQCRSTCQKSETDCTGGYYCHPFRHRCVAAVNLPAGELPSCSFGTRPIGNRHLAPLAAACLLLGACRRRARATRPR